MATCLLRHHATRQINTKFTVNSIFLRPTSHVLPSFPRIEKTSASVYVLNRPTREWRYISANRRGGRVASVECKSLAPARRARRIDESPYLISTPMKFEYAASAEASKCAPLIRFVCIYICVFRGDWLVGRQTARSLGSKNHALNPNGCNIVIVKLLRHLQHINTL